VLDLRPHATTAPAAARSAGAVTASRVLATAGMIVAMELWRVDRPGLEPDNWIPPGTYGAVVRGIGAPHRHFAREHLLEFCRTTYTIVPVSRLTAAFTFSERHDAETHAAERLQLNPPPPPEQIYRVEPIDPTAPAVRLDMWWITLLREPVGLDELVARCRAYWEGQATSDPRQPPRWEWLHACPLVIREAVTPAP
jgi:hypothetical protein